MRHRWIAGWVAGAALVAGAATFAQQQLDVTPRERAIESRDTPNPSRLRWRSPDLVKSGDRPNSRDELPQSKLAVDPAPAPPSAPAVDDPMASVESFLARNRKEAHESIRALTDEAEALRARLAKVEAALGRWQGIAAALNPGGEPPTDGSGAPVILEPVPPPPPSAPSDPAPILPEPGRPGTAPTPDPTAPSPPDAAPRPIEAPSAPKPSNTLPDPSIPSFPQPN